MKNLCVLGALLVMVLVFPGCSPFGLIYTHTVKPLDINMDQTKNLTEHDWGDIKNFSYSLVNVMWDSNAIGDIAKEHGMETVYFADIESLRILMVWNQYWVRVYGK